MQGKKAGPIRTTASWLLRRTFVNPSFYKLCHKICTFYTRGKTLRQKRQILCPLGPFNYSFKKVIFLFLSWNSISLWLFLLLTLHLAWCQWLLLCSEQQRLRPVSPRPQADGKIKIWHWALIERILFLPVLEQPICIHSLC